MIPSRSKPSSSAILYRIAEELGFDLDGIIDRKELPQFLQALANNGIGVEQSLTSQGNVM